MTYTSISDLTVQWTYNELQSLPLFMRESIYKILDENLEELKQANLKMKQGM